MTKLNIVYPHRIPFLSHKKKCDVCHIECTNTLYINRYIGFLHCNNDTCINIIKDWINTTTKTFTELCTKYGSSINIERSNGMMESNWSILGSSYQESSTSKFWVEVVTSKGDSIVKKLVTLDQIDKWNK